jgi:hypothetical protein
VTSADSLGARMRGYPSHPVPSARPAAAQSCQLSAGLKSQSQPFLKMSPQPHKSPSEQVGMFSFPFWRDWDLKSGCSTTGATASPSCFRDFSRRVLRFYLLQTWIMVFLPKLSHSWDYRCAPLHLASIRLFSESLHRTKGCV